MYFLVFCFIFQSQQLLFSDKFGSVFVATFCFLFFFNLRILGINFNQQEIFLLPQSIYCISKRSIQLKVTVVQVRKLPVTSYATVVQFLVFSKRTIFICSVQGTTFASVLELFLFCFIQPDFSSVLQVYMKCSIY